MSLPGHQELSIPPNGSSSDGVSGSTRRQFLATAAGAAAASAVAWGAPAVLTAQKSDTKILTGPDDHRYEVVHDWAQLPARYQWQTTHNVAVDGEGLLYVIHEGREDQPDHPSIFVFDDQGQFVRAFGQQFQGGGHGIEVRREGDDQFLYVCAYQQCKTFAKMTLQGEVVWQKFAPMQSGLYAENEDTEPKKVWGRDRFMPTNFAFLDEGGFLLADGYGSFYIHRYDARGDWQSCWGGPGEGAGTFNTPHGLWIDRRPGREPSVVVTDRAHHTLQIFSLEGEYQETLDGYGLPANLDSWRDLMVVPELFGRLTLLDPQNRVVARLGDDSERIRQDTQMQIRGDSDRWLAGRFVHPHDACFDSEGNLFVAEWVATGRITKLNRLS
jgi:hypothetical protein